MKKIIALLTTLMVTINLSLAVNFGGLTWVEIPYHKTYYIEYGNQDILVIYHNGSLRYFMGYYNPITGQIYMIALINHLGYQEQFFIPIEK